MSPNAAKTSERRSHEERSRTMRERLVKATIENLAEEGYAATTLSGVVRRAGVSRGAQVHHYASKNELILDAAIFFLRHTYRHLGEVLLNIADEEDRLRAMVFAAWEEIYGKPSANAFIELIMASQYEKNLANSVRQLNHKIADAMVGPINHYFESRDSTSETPITMFRGLIVYMSGLACSRVIMTNDEIKAGIEYYCRLMKQHLRARKGVLTPPPVPQLFE